MKKGVQHPHIISPVEHSCKHNQETYDREKQQYRTNDYQLFNCAAFTVWFVVMV